MHINITKAFQNTYPIASSQPYCFVVLYYVRLVAGQPCALSRTAQRLAVQQSARRIVRVIAIVLPQQYCEQVSPHENRKISACHFSQYFFLNNCVSYDTRGHLSLQTFHFITASFYFAHFIKTYSFLLTYLIMSRRNMLRDADAEQRVRRLGASEGGARGWTIRGGSRDHVSLVQVSLLAI